MSTIANRWDALSSRQFFLLILVVGIITRVGLVVGSKSYLEPERAELVRVAQSLAEHGSFANPFCGETGLTAHVAPGYPFLLSALYKVMGTGLAGEITKQILTSVIAALGYALLPIMAVQCNMSVQIGAIAGLLGAVFPVRKWQETNGGFEIVYAAVVFMVVFLLTLKSWRNGRFTYATALLNGLTWGVLLLFSPAFLTVLVGVLIAGGFIFLKTSRYQYSRYAAVVAVVCGAVLAPWTIRNYKVFGSFIPIRDNFGLELYVSNNDKSKPTLDENLEPKGSMDSYHPFNNCAEAVKVRLEGELNYNHDKLRTALIWIRTHPKNFVKLSIMRLMFFWFTAYRPRVKAILFGIMTILGIIGGALLLQKERSIGVLFFTVWIFYPLTFYFIQADGRYRYPIDWTFLLLAVYAVNRATKLLTWGSN